MPPPPGSPVAMARVLRDIADTIRSLRFSLIARDLRVARDLRDIADTIRSDYPVESNALTNMAATLSSLPADVRPVGSGTEDDSAASEEER